MYLRLYKRKKLNQDYGKKENVISDPLYMATLTSGHPLCGHNYEEYILLIAFQCI